ncbi:MAG: hypothetical protein IKU22_06780 [Alistipes sp.]|nr:hypothetical protein [Alistipes sp.]
MKNIFNFDVTKPRVVRIIDAFRVKIEPNFAAKWGANSAKTGGKMSKNHPKNHPEKSNKTRVQNRAKQGLDLSKKKQKKQQNFSENQR